ncbi:MAG: DUF4350 domain-containing protein [Kofleriaceae bacterium]|nr:DUF4350 domain-containing protein [Kofleriaceae bacterium]
MCFSLGLPLQGTGVAHADDSNYQVDNTGWDGVSTLAALAEGIGLQVIQERYIEWEDLDSDDLVFLIYPTTLIDSTAVVSFIRNGGRVLVADDFGQAYRIFGRLGGRRSEDVTASRYYENKVFAPVAEPTGSHPLSDGISYLTTNHPTTIRNLEGMTSVFDFQDGSSVVAAGRIGAGRYVALSDPSVLINRMLQFEGNLLFAINLIRYLVRPGQSDRLIILSGDITLAGTPRNQYDDGTWNGAASVLATNVDGWLDQLNTWLLTTWGLRMLTVLLSTLLAIGVFLSIPRRRSRPLDGSWTRASSPEKLTSMAVIVDLNKTPRVRTSYLLPAAMARDNINSALEQFLDEPDPLFSIPEPQLLRKCKDRGGEELAETLRSLLPRLRNIPQRAQAAAHWQPRHLGLSELEKIHNHSLALFEQLKLLEKNS